MWKGANRTIRVWYGRQEVDLRSGPRAKENASYVLPSVLATILEKEIGGLDWSDSQLSLRCTAQLRGHRSPLSLSCPPNRRTLTVDRPRCAAPAASGGPVPTGEPQAAVRERHCAGVSRFRLVYSQELLVCSPLPDSFEGMCTILIAPFAQDVTVENVGAMFDLAEKHHAPNLKNKCVQVCNRPVVRCGFRCSSGVGLRARAAEKGLGHLAVVHSFTAPRLKCLFPVCKAALENSRRVNCLPPAAEFETPGRNRKVFLTQYSVWVFKL
jgi:hypothetical protein